MRLLMQVACVWISISGLCAAQPAIPQPAVPPPVIPQWEIPAFPQPAVPQPAVPQPAILNNFVDPQLPAPQWVRPQKLQPGFDVFVAPGQPGAPVDYARRRKETRAFMDELVDAIAQKCSLTDEQKKRLQVAAKGAVELSTKRPEPDFKPDPAPPAGDDLRHAAMVQQLALVKQLQNDVQIVNLHWGGHHATHVIQHPVWIKTLHSTLDGRDLFTAHAIQRDLVNRYNTVNFRAIPQNQFRGFAPIQQPVPIQQWDQGFEWVKDR